jgi:antitoxin component YwqK of YwqJK toxin-antitoxin module
MYRKSKCKVISYILTVIFFIAIDVFAFGQQTTNPNGYNVFYYKNGKKQSEGNIRDGKPDGYWKNYNENGTLKSEGNRKNYLLDSTWKFCDETGKLLIEINYKNDKKNGIKKTYREQEITEENFINDVKQGITRIYYPNGKIKKAVNFENGLESGIAREYDTIGNIIALYEYKRGFVTNYERINRSDKNGWKQGVWKDFYENGNVKWEITYKDNKKNGYFKQYSQDGNLTEVVKYIDDIRQEEAKEVIKLEVKTDYYPNGKPKTIASYRKNVPEGVRREFSEDGKVTAGYVFEEGKIISQGIIDEEGIKNGPWKDFYRDGQLKSEGIYNKDKRVGEWKFYYNNGQVEQSGKYNKNGKPDGLWKWNYPDGSLKREENFLNGLSEGIMTEYDEQSKIICQGEYIAGLEEGKWTYHTGDRWEEGTYRGGMRNGEWKSYYPDGKLSFEGNYIDDNPNGRHTWYWDNGNRKDEGKFIMGRKDGDWITFNYDGTPFLVISYKNGIEKSYDGIKIKPEPTEE